MSNIACIEIFRIYIHLIFLSLDDEEIDEHDLFMSLNESDFKRLELSTKMVKIIDKIQKNTSIGTIN